MKTGSANSAITRPTTVGVTFFREIVLSMVGPERLKYTGGSVRSRRELVHDTTLAVRLVVVNRSRTWPAIRQPQPVVPQRCQCDRTPSGRTRMAPFWNFVSPEGDPDRTSRPDIFADQSVDWNRLT